MAIKTLLCSSQIADQPFRSLQDVEKYLDQVKIKVQEEDQLLRRLEQQWSRTLQKAALLDFKINREGGPTRPGSSSPSINAQRFDKVSVPDLKSLRDNFSIVDELSDQVDQLNTLHSQVSVSFRGVRGTNDTLKNILAMKAGLENKLKKALAFLSKIGSDYAPQSFKDQVNEVCQSLSENLTFSDYHVMGYATARNDRITFTTYVQLMNLQEENGDQYPEFFVVFTLVLNPDPHEKGQMMGTQYVTVMHSFQTPGKFHPGKPWTTVDNATTAIGTLLAIENITNAIGALPHNVDPSKVDKSQFRDRDLIADIKVEPDSITFVFLKNANAEQVKSAGNRLFVEMKALMKKGLKRTQDGTVKVRMSRNPSDRRYNIKFTLSAPAQDDQLDVHSLDFLKEQFGLDDDKLRKVVNIINHG